MPRPNHPHKVQFLSVLFICMFESVLAAPQADDANPGLTFGPDPGSDLGSLAPPPIPAYFDKIKTAHAVLASMAWLVFFPFGAILIRTLKTRWEYGDVRVHAAVQLTGLVTFAGAAALGIWMARTIQMLHHYHPITGMVLLGCLGFQPLTELLNARLYRRYPRVIYLAHVHIWFGRLLITAGIINGGLGFVFSGSFSMGLVDPAPRIAYGVAAIVVWVLYVSLAIVWPETKHSFRWWHKRQGTGGGDVEELRTRSLADTPSQSLADRRNGTGK